MSTKYDLLKERALLNFELLLIKWNLNYAKVGRCEFDFLSPTRSGDTNFGACRFNTDKGIGADFAVSNYTNRQITGLGIGFNASDFAGYSGYGQSKPGFDVIGLAQRVYNSCNYKEAAERLKQDLDEIDGGKVNKLQLLEQSIKREAEIEARRSKSLLSAAQAWKYCVNINGTLGEVYLKSRGIHGPYNETNVKFCHSIYNTELGKYCPAIVLKISKTRESQLSGVHRIYLSDDGATKAKVSEPKKAIGSVQGNGIWFGEPDTNLFVCEGPENALDLRYHKGLKFVVSTISSSNLHSLFIPSTTKLVIIVPDPDPAGLTAATKAHVEYSRQGKNVKILKI